MFGPLNDKAYKVGGCVRDDLLGKPSIDEDYVIEATEEEFRKVFPDAEHVGKNFPVYIIGGHEVALTRTERCIGEGYTDYEVTGVGVPIGDDLLRRDFTINSIAKHVVTGAYVDPTNGRKDLESRIIRCANPEAFNDDPLRIYRAARFLSRFCFAIDGDTESMIKANVGKLEKVKPERVSPELAKVYEQCYPGNFFKWLHRFGALMAHFKPLEALLHVPAGPKQYHTAEHAFDHVMDVIDACKDAGHSFDCFVACLVHDFGKATTDPEILPHHYGHEFRSKDIAKAWFAEHRFTAREQKLGLCVAVNHMKMHFMAKMKTRKCVEFYRGIPSDLKQDFLNCCNCDHRLSDEVMRIWDDISIAFKTTPILVPKECKDPHAYVTDLITKQMKHMEATCKRLD